MKRYSILLISFIASVIIFIILITVQNNIVNRDNLVQAYIITQDINMYEDINLDMLKRCLCFWRYYA